MSGPEELASAAPPPAPRAEPGGAGPLLRLGAFAIDAGIVGAAGWGWVLVAWELMPVKAPWLAPLGLLGLAVGYYGWAAARNHHTLGQAFAGLTLARVDYQPLSTRRAYGRTVLFMLTSGMALPNLVIMLVDKKRRTIHDFLTKTWVFALPDFDPRKRAATRAAGVLLLLALAARALLAWSDRLEASFPLSIAEIARGEDGAKP